MFKLLFFGLIIGVVTVIGDFFVKKGSLMPHFTGFKSLLLGAFIYGITAIGWFFMMRETKLSTIGTIYSITTVVLLTLVGIFYFKERISIMEIIGIGLAIISFVILSKFS